MSWMLRSRRLGEFVERYGGADDQLYGGNSVTPRMEGELALRTDKGRNDYCFALSYAHPDRFIFTEEAYRFSPDRYATEPDWQHVTGGHREAAIVEVAQASSSVGPNPVTARVIVHLLRGCQYSSSTTRPIPRISRSGGTRKTTTTCARMVGISPLSCIDWRRKMRDTSDGSMKASCRVRCGRRISLEGVREQIDFPRDCVAVLRAVREQFTTPEDINDNYETAPSRRIAGIVPRYDKRLHGPILAEEVGRRSPRSRGRPRWAAGYSAGGLLADLHRRGARGGPFL